MTGALTNKIQLTVIVPVLNEIEVLPQFLSHLQKQWKTPQKIILVDGGSTDGSWEWIQQNWSEGGFQTQRGRGHQMNFGAEQSTTAGLYFVHVDSKLPHHFDLQIAQALEAGCQAGCFQLVFDHANWLLRRAAAGSRWNHLLCRGGDQSLFVHRELFQKLGGYDTRFKVCEDLDLIKRLYRKVKFRVLPQKIQTSSRRFYENGTLRLLIHFGIMHFSHWLGAGPQFLYRYYGTFVR